MSVISDLDKLLDKIPLWKRLQEIPKHFDELKAEFQELKTYVASLEAEIRKRPPAEQCPICKTGNLNVIHTRPHPTLGPVGVQERTVKCDNSSCGHTEKRRHDP
jgi:hypothetical protein